MSFLSAICCGFIMGYIYRWRGVPFIGKWKTPFLGFQNEFSIGISVGATLESLQQNSTLVLSRHDVSDVNANFVADPFLFHKKQQWYMFMEVHNKSRDIGEIGMATSQNGLQWTYQSIVLREPFHLSYPYVFQHQQTIWMIPETGQDNSVRLYRSIEFPKKWKLEKKLLIGKHFTDPSVFKHNGYWWMFVSNNQSRDLLLYFANDLLGSWKKHPCSPIVYDEPQKARCAGRVVTINGKLIRFVQNCEHEYGKSVDAFSIDCLDKTNYKETQLGNSSILYPAGNHWKASGMHHIDIHTQTDDSYLAAVDGWRPVRDFGIKY